MYGSIEGNFQNHRYGKSMFFYSFRFDNEHVMSMLRCDTNILYIKTHSFAWVLDVVMGK